MIATTTPYEYSIAIHALDDAALAEEYERATAAFHESVQANHSSLTLAIAGRQMELAAREVGHRRQVARA